MIRIAMLLSLSLGLAAPVLGQEDDEDNPFAPGLLARYTQGDTGAQRIELSPALAWEQSPPDARFAPGPIEVIWSGRLLTQGADTYRLHVYGQGQIKIDLAGQTVLEGKSDRLRWFSTAALKLEHDYHPVTIHYRHGDEAKRLRVFWSSDSFPLEPLPAKQLWHEKQLASASASHYERGAQVARSQRCAACHAIPGEAEVLAAPAIDKLYGNIHLPWLLRSLDETHYGAAQISPDEAADIAAALTGGAQPAKVELTGNAKQGERLVHSLGCLACHTLGDQGTTDLFGGGDLSNIANKRPAGFFAAWLKSPAELNRHHRMPVFELSAADRNDLAAFLAQQKQPTKAPAPASHAPNAARGKALLASKRCTSCHHMPGADVQEKLASPKSADCRFVALPQTIDAPAREALHVYMAASKAQQPRTPALDGARILAEKNCLACHAREGAEGLAPKLLKLAERDAELTSLVPALTPPSLVAVGDKLNDTVLLAMIKRMEQPHRDYLHVRMPRFDLSQDELEAMLAYFVSYDRIPPQPPDDRARPPQNLPPAKDLAAAGEKLVVAGSGFGCTSCHAIGSYKPSKAPINARGPNLSEIGFRIREPFFYRWCQNPARIIPGQEMPSVSVPVKGLLKENLHHQLAAVWQTLNTKGFEPKDAGPLRIVSRSADPQAEERAVIGTDVIKIEGHTYIAPLVIGLPNRHNVLLDLETGRLARWWMGDTMEQRTQGKTWFWQSEAPDLLQAGFTTPEIMLVRDGKELLPIPQGQKITQIEEWTHSLDGLALDYRLQYQLDADEKPWTLHLEEIITPAERETDDPAHGFNRIITVRDALPKGVELRLRVAGAKRLETIKLTEDRRQLTAAEGVEVTIRTPDTGLDADGTIVFRPLPEQETLGVYLEYRVPGKPVPVMDEPTPDAIAQQQSLDVVPGLQATRLPFNARMMPTGMAWLPVGEGDPALRLAIASLEGRVWLARDRDGDGIEDDSLPISDELAAPYGIAAVAGSADQVDVITKSAVLRLSLSPSLSDKYEPQVPALSTQVMAQGWGHTDDYHDWAVGLIPNKDGYLVALPCQQDNRSEAAARHRGQVLDIRYQTDKAGQVESQALKPLSAGHRFPMGIARNRAGDVFVTDNQGNYNPFNELNHVQPGKHFGFVNALDKKKEKAPTTPPAINIPHPWTRSVNGICFLETPEALAKERDRLWGPFEGHLIGCEYDTRRLIRMSLQKVGDTYQGACYPFSVEPKQGDNFLGPVSCAIAPTGALYIGSIRDSGWGGGANVGEIVRIAPPKSPESLPAGIAAVTANKEGFVITFTRPIDAKLAADPKSYSIESFTRESTPAYGGPDLHRRGETITAVTVAEDRRSVQLTLDGLSTGFVYEFHLKKLTTTPGEFFPAEAYYTLNAIP